MSTPPNSAHRNKRPFQPSITSYFARTADRSDSDVAPSPTAGAGAQPPHQGLAAVPANVQASLLNVGMRVRKSVPEGYKTHKTIIVPSSANANTYTPQATVALQASTGRPNELTPFCGIHKTGGYDVQQHLQPNTYFHYQHLDMGNKTSSSAAAQRAGVDAHANIAFSADDFGGPLSSQESIVSIISTGSLPPHHRHTTNKRRHVDEEEESLLDDHHGEHHHVHNGGALFPRLNTNLAVDDNHDEELQVSPRTTVYPVSHTAMPNLSMSSGRPVARPRSRRWRNAGHNGGAGRRQAVDEDSLDFGEADFLRPPSSDSWGENDVEVEMGGV